MTRRIWLLTLLVAAASVGAPTLADAQRRRSNSGWYGGEPDSYGRPQYGRRSRYSHLGVEALCPILIVAGTIVFIIQAGQKYSRDTKRRARSQHSAPVWAALVRGHRAPSVFPNPSAGASASPADERSFFQIQWNALPLATRARLVDAQRSPSQGGVFWLPGGAEERVWRRDALPDPKVSIAPGLLIAVVLAPLLGVALLSLGFADPESELLWQGRYALAFYVVAIGAGLGSAFRIARALWERPAPNFREGSWLSPLCLLELRGNCLRVHPLNRCVGLQLATNSDFGAQGRHGFGALSLRFDDSELTYKVSGDLRDYLARAEQQARALAQGGPNPAVQRELDPLFEAIHDPTWPSVLASGAAPPLAPPREGPSFALPRPTPVYLRPRWFALAAAALLLGPGVWLLRNYLSDTNAYEFARSEALPAQRAYARNGWLYAAEMQEDLPYLEARAGDPPERTLAAFVQRYPRHAKVAEARALLHGRYAAAAQAFASQGSTDDRTIAPFIQRILDFQERSGSPSVVVRFEPPPPEALAAFDAEVGAVGRARGEAPIAFAPHFDEEEMKARETRVLQALQTSFRGVFSEGVLRLEDGGRGALGAAPPGAVRFGITYALAHTGSHLAGGGPAVSLPGADFEFRAVVSVPDAGPPFSFTTVVVPPTGDVNMPLVTRTRGHPSGSAAADRAFALFSDRLRGAFFRQGAAALGPVREDDSPSTTRARDVSGSWRATIVDPTSTEPATVRLTFAAGAQGLRGAYQSGHRGPRVPDGAIDGAQRGQRLIGVCSDVEGASGSCAFTFANDGQRFEGMSTAGGVRHYWLGVRRGAPAQ